MLGEKFQIRKFTIRIQISKFQSSEETIEIFRFLEIILFNFIANLVSEIWNFISIYIEFSQSTR